MVESAIVLYDDLLIDYTVGSSVHVDFDFQKIWKFKSYIKDFDANLLTFYHVHPEGCLWYSQTDKRCMKALGIAFGVQVHFSIICFGKIQPECISFKYDKDKKEVCSIDNNYLGDSCIELLHGMSYKG